VSVISNLSDNNDMLNISVSGRFDFHVVKEFRASYSEAEESTSGVVLDFRDVSYMDSSALGMLLNMNKYFKEQAKISIINCRPEIKKVLLISKFDQKFSIR